MPLQRLTDAVQKMVIRFSGREAKVSGLRKGQKRLDYPLHALR